ncbi:MAG: hypothetical protein LBU25_11435 [Treponema sp.]|nr:hypothetical protein [Treponema sp.]
MISPIRHSARRALAQGVCAARRRVAALPLELSFSEAWRGKKVFFADRWESGTVKKGPETEIFSAVIS